MERMRNEERLFVWDSSLRLASPNSKLNRMTIGQAKLHTKPFGLNKKPTSFDLSVFVCVEVNLIFEHDSQQKEFLLLIPSIMTN